MGERVATGTRAWQRHIAEKHDNGKLLFCFLCYILWLGETRATMTNAKKGATDGRKGIGSRTVLPPVEHSLRKQPRGLWPGV